ncbi:MAG: metallophosphoesterase [Candidatus Zixiibacteriota bacterium]|nr:MAG: metallophosphoesterase [candidate division Zixibacteria bacterium]
MRLALISDIHGNLTALQAVFADIDQQDVDAVHCLGDIIGYGPEPTACLELVTRRCKVKLLGNHEYVVMGLESTEQMNRVARKAAEWTISQLGEREISMLADFDMEHRFDRYMLVHASPHEPESWHYVLTIAEARKAFAAMETDLCFVGHTHIPMVFRCEDDGTIRQQDGHDFTAQNDMKYLVNIGSVGQPRDDDPRSSYVLLDTESAAVRFRRVEYDVTATQEKMVEVDMPRMLIDRLAVGR